MSQKRKLEEDAKWVNEQRLGKRQKIEAETQEGLKVAKEREQTRETEWDKIETDFLANKQALESQLQALEEKHKQDKNKHNTKYQADDDAESAEALLAFYDELLQNPNRAYCFDPTKYVSPLEKAVINDLFGGYVKLNASFALITEQAFGCYTPDWKEVSWSIDEEDNRNPDVYRAGRLCFDRDEMGKIDKIEELDEFPEQPDSEVIADWIKRENIDPDSYYSHKIGNYFRVDYPVTVNVLTVQNLEKCKL